MFVVSSSVGPTSRFLSLTVEQQNSTDAIVFRYFLAYSLNAFRNTDVDMIGQMEAIPGTDVKIGCCPNGTCYATHTSPTPKQSVAVHWNPNGNKVRLENCHFTNEKRASRLYTFFSGLVDLLGHSGEGLRHLLGQCVVRGGRGAINLNKEIKKLFCCLLFVLINIHVKNRRGE